jgi:hypothetical protein
MKSRFEGDSMRFFSCRVDAFECIPTHMNTKIGPETKDHNSYPREFQQIVGRFNHR